MVQAGKCDQQCDRLFDGALHLAILAVGHVVDTLQGRQHHGHREEQAQAVYGAVQRCAAEEILFASLLIA